MKLGSIISLAGTLLLYGCSCMSGYENEYFDNLNGLVTNQTVTFQNQESGDKISFHATTVDCSIESKKYNDDDCTCKVYKKCAQRFRLDPEGSHYLDFSFARSSTPYANRFNVYFQRQYFILEHAIESTDTTMIAIQSTNYTCYELTLLNDANANGPGPQQVFACLELGIVRIITKDDQIWTRIN